jgi:hypothetical protein
MKLCAFAVAASCGSESLPQRLEDACEARACPSDPPKFIDCMPIIAPEWQPLCGGDCRVFLEQTCKIEYVE